LFPAIVVLFLGGCGGSAKPSARLDRTAILPFENLSGDPFLDRWRIPFQQTFQIMAGARGSAPDKDAALLAGATVLARGTMERVPATNHIQLTVELYDVATHKLLQSDSVEDADPFAAVTKLAKSIQPNAQSLGLRSAEALPLWMDVLNATSPLDYLDRCRKLLDAEPGFGPAYVSCGSAPLSAVDRLAAGERGYANRASFQPDAQLAVGQFLFQSGKFPQAIETMTLIAPSMPVAWNSVGYSQAMLGNISEAKKALEEYRKLGGDEANAVDSLGEVHYIVAKYDDAEKYFLEGAEKFPQTRQGRVARLKAACMRALRGNRGGAEELAQSIISDVKKSGQNAKPLEDLWRGIILEQDPLAMRKRIESGGIIVPPGGSR